MCTITSHYSSLCPLQITVQSFGVTRSQMYGSTLKPHWRPFSPNIRADDFSLVPAARMAVLMVLSSNAVQLVRHSGGSAQHPAQRADCVTAARRAICLTGHRTKGMLYSASLIKDLNFFTISPRTLASHQKAVQSVAVRPEEMLVTVDVTQRYPGRSLHFPPGATHCWCRGQGEVSRARFS